MRRVGTCRVLPSKDSALTSSFPLLGRALEVGEKNFCFLKLASLQVVLLKWGRPKLKFKTSRSVIRSCPRAVRDVYVQVLCWDGSPEATRVDLQRKSLRMFLIVLEKRENHQKMQCRYSNLNSHRLPVFRLSQISFSTRRLVEIVLFSVRCRTAESRPYFKSTANERSQE